MRKRLVDISDDDDLDAISAVIQDACHALVMIVKKESRERGDDYAAMTFDMSFGSHPLLLTEKWEIVVRPKVGGDG